MSTHRKSGQFFHDWETAILRMKSRLSCMKNSPIGSSTLDLDNVMTTLHQKYGNCGDVITHSKCLPDEDRSPC